MKKMLFSVAAATMFAIVPFVSNAATTWDVTGVYVINVNYLGSDYPETLVLAQSGTSITGVSLNTIPPAAGSAFTVISGSVVGDAVDFLADQNTGSLVVHMQGTIAADGSMNGTWADVAPGTRTGTWATVSGAAVNTDSDGDGVLNGADLCPGTTDDGAWLEGIGQNRWQVMDGVWKQHNVKKGVVTDIPGEGIAYTYGCNGHQILEMLEGVMNGHLKFGLSSSVVEDFHLDLQDGVLDGRYFLETVVVPANDADGVSSSAALLADHTYAFKVSGTADAGDGILFDADYSFRTLSSITWTDAVSTYEYLGDTLLDLMVNGGFVNWDDDAVYNADHTYWYQFAGAGAPVTFGVNDTYAPNNTGSLSVDIYAEI